MRHKSSKILKKLGRLKLFCLCMHKFNMEFFIPRQNLQITKIGRRLERTPLLISLVRRNILQIHIAYQSKFHMKFLHDGRAFKLPKVEKRSEYTPLLILLVRRKMLEMHLAYQPKFHTSILHLLHLSPITVKLPKLGEDRRAPLY